MAEIGCNHMGNVEIAKELLTLTKMSGADYGKFQKRNPKELLTPEQFAAPHPTRATRTASPTVLTASSSSSPSTTTVSSRRCAFRYAPTPRSHPLCWARGPSWRFLPRAPLLGPGRSPSMTRGPCVSTVRVCSASAVPIYTTPHPPTFPTCSGQRRRGRPSLPITPPTLSSGLVFWGLAPTTNPWPLRSAAVQKELVYYPLPTLGPCNP